MVPVDKIRNTQTKHKMLCLFVFKLAWGSNELIEYGIKDSGLLWYFVSIESGKH